MITEHIHIDLHCMDGQELCETRMKGEYEVLASMIFSAMQTNIKFAEIVQEACYNYAIVNADPEKTRQAILN